MKKIFGYFIFVVILIFTMPIVFTDNFDKVEETSADETTKNYEKANYGDLSIIKLLHTDSGEVEELEFDEYLYGVVSAELPFASSSFLSIFFKHS